MPLTSILPIGRRRRIVVGAMLAWLGVAVVAALQEYLSAAFAGRPLSVIEASLRHLPILAVWAAATPLIFRSVVRWPFIGRNWKMHLPLHLLFGCSFLIGINAAWPVLYPFAYTELTAQAWLTTTASQLARWLPLGFIVYLVIGAIGHLVHLPQDGPRFRTDDDAPEFLPKRPGRLTIRGLNRSFVVSPEEIRWVEASGDHVIYHVDGRSLKERRRMKEVERLLSSFGFVRVHRSAIVQVARIREVHALDHGDFLIQLDDGARVRLSRSRRKSLEAALGRSI